MSTQTLHVTFQFAASHFLTKYHGKCENLHGHNYKLITSLKGTVKEDGMVFDFKQIKEIVENKILKHLDHHHLNDILENPSAENMLIWIWEKLKPELPELCNLKLYETENYCAEYDGN